MLVGSVSPFKQTGNTRGPRVRGNRVSFARDNVSLSKPCRWNKPFRNQGRRGRVYPQEYRNNDKAFFNLSRNCRFCGEKGGEESGREYFWISFSSISTDGWKIVLEIVC